ncbi:MAG: P1 family peptidase [Hyphomicrobiaceae bacterium]|nr:P1 family peptidase [Hyphomicrobiaceae bacterium]
MRAGRLNLLTDVAGLSVGNAHDAASCSGVSVVLCDAPAVAAVDVRGGGPGTRETDALGLAGTVEAIHAVVLSGGSAFGLAAAGAVQERLAKSGVGFKVGDIAVPIVPQAVLFDLAVVARPEPPLPDLYRRLALAACEDASQGAFALGSAGAGYGATTARLRGGLGSASALLEDGITVGALVAVNPVGCVTCGEAGHFWAHPFEIGEEFGGLGGPAAAVRLPTAPRLKGWASALGAPGPMRPGGAGQNTTIAVIATNVRLDRRQCHRLAVMAQTGLARAIHPVHTPLDGDSVFAIATGYVSLRDAVYGLAELGSVAADTLSRAVARAIYMADAPPPHWRGPPAWRHLFATPVRSQPDHASRTATDENEP